MKNVISFFSAVFLFTLTAKSQVNTNNFRIGLTNGIEKNISSKNIAFDKHTGYSAHYNKTNYRLGLSFEYRLKKTITLNTAINYSNKDFSANYYCAVCDFISPPSTQNIAFRFIEMPLTVKHYFLSNKIRPFGEFGINNLILLNKEVTDNSYSFGIKIGGGLEYILTKKISLQIVMDYYKGISKLYKQSDFKLKSLAFGIGIIKSL